MEGLGCRAEGWGWWRAEDGGWGGWVRLPAVDEEQAAEEAELADGKVGVVDGLHALLADDAHANLPRLRSRKGRDEEGRACVQRVYFV